MFIVVVAIYFLYGNAFLSLNVVWVIKTQCSKICFGMSCNVMVLTNFCTRHLTDTIHFFMHFFSFLFCKYTKWIIFSLNFFILHIWKVKIWISIYFFSINIVNIIIIKGIWILSNIKNCRFFWNTYHFRCEVVSLRPATLLKERLWHKCIPVNLAKSRKLWQNTLDGCFC